MSDDLAEYTGMRVRAPSADLEASKEVKTRTPQTDRWSAQRPQRVAEHSTSDWVAQLPFILAATVMMTLQPILVKLSQSNGKTNYSVFFSTFLSGRAV